MRIAACLLTILVGGCGAPTATPQPALDDGTSTPPPGTSTPPVAETPPAALGTTPRLATGVDPARDACKVDADCQLIASCSCTNCIASKKMHVELCPEACKVDACSGHKPRCTGGACTSDQPVPNAPSPEILDAASRAGQLVLDDPRFLAYLHAKERPERLPMVIAWEPGVPHPTWNVGGKPATFVEGLPASLSLASDHGARRARVGDVPVQVRAGGNRGLCAAREKGQRVDDRRPRDHGALTRATGSTSPSRPSLIDQA